MGFGWHNPDFWREYCLWGETVNVHGEGEERLGVAGSKWLT